MADKATQLAQAAADGLSRRSFLGRFGRSAAVDGNHQEEMMARAIVKKFE